MGFSVNIDRPAHEPTRSASAMSAKTMFGIVAVLFAVFCAWDYSSYGGGYVNASLGAMQHSFQGFVLSFRLRM